MNYLRIFLLMLLFVWALSSCKEKNATAANQTSIQNKTWWKEAVIYQIYPRSFKDSDGDGIGDIKGIISKLDYIQSLGIDAVWLNPIYESPNKDNGYDISDYRNVSKQFGSMNDFDTLLAGFHNRGIKVFMDLVVNHCSNEHPWFKEASKSRNSPYYNYFHWWPAEKGEPPYRFSIFDEKGYGWEFNKATNSYYLHYFGDFQPDLNWENPKLRQEVYDIMKFWSKKGIDGFRMDALAFISKDTTWPGLPAEYNGNWPLYYASGPHLHDYIQEMNKEVLTPYKLATVAEAMGDVPRVKKFVDEDRNELNMAYNFEAIDFGYLPNEYKMPDPKGWDLVKWKQIYKRWDSAFSEKGWGTVYLANHDQPRMVTRWGNDAPEFRELSSKMLNTFILTMRGTAFTYYGDEIGMNNIKFDKVEDYNDVELLTNYAQVKAKGGDLKRFLEGMKISSRDNGRTPMQWDSTAGAGFTLATPWLKINPNYTTVNVAAAEANNNSALHYFRKLTKLRKANEALQYGTFTLVDADNPDVFAYTRTLNNKIFLILLNFKNKTATVKTGLDLSKGKTVLNNYGSANVSETLQPYEASVIEL
ncbi:oligo-1,6-glucosidase [Lacibacter cauensis]|uniref:Oligo-1,6-glucosidase n=1 Tax=Lacibacter cauensis TaxID=510947 RepID=A0A562SQR6_9BACT|nr:alpha-glucosidase [Lacibacter cauensis]TWI83146.1 oligo-1,6-glucosidase [Lacibacter cauensis]